MDSDKEKTFYCLFSDQKKGEIILHSTFKDNFFDVFTGEIEYTEPIETKIKKGSKFFDVIFFDDGVNFVISDKLYQLLHENNITGWKTYPVSIKNVNEKYHGFQIVGRSGGLIEPNSKGFYKGYKFDVSTWDGSDFFSPKDTQLRFFTQRVKYVLQENGITNIDIDKIEEVEAYSYGT